jgi:hypothetical protein
MKTPQRKEPFAERTGIRVFLDRIPENVFY